MLVKIAQLEQHCLTMTTRLEASRKELQSLRVQRRDTVAVRVTSYAMYDEAIQQRWRSDRWRSPSKQTPAAPPRFSTGDAAVAASYAEYNRTISERWRGSTTSSISRVGRGFCWRCSSVVSFQPSRIVNIAVALRGHSERQPGGIVLPR